jgi:hypothetical protein
MEPAMKIQIKSKYDSSVLFEGEFGSLKLCLEVAVKSCANLSLADLSGANLSCANLYGANLSCANLYGANLYGANLSCANLYGADLYGADLYGADMSGANLSCANLSGADLSKTTGINQYLSTPLLILAEQPGKIRAYKMVSKDGFSPITTTKRILYEIGKSYSVENANMDVSEMCAAGISLATLDWCMKEWREGWRILVAEFTAKDIAAIPTATDGKFRVHRCKIVGEKDLKEIGLIK